MRLDGIDVSVWQGVIDWPTVGATPLELVICKATEGSHFRDHTFHRNYIGATLAGIPKVGAYHFMSNAPAPAQFANLERVLDETVTPHGTELPPGFMLALDYESNGATGDPPPEVGTLLELLELCEQRWPGRVCWYTYTSLARRVESVVPIGRPLWLADYTTGGPRAVQELGAFLWQWSSTQHQLGIATRIDANEIMQRSILEHLTKQHTTPEVDDEMKPLHLIVSSHPADEGVTFVAFASGLVRHLGPGEATSPEYGSLHRLDEGTNRAALYRLVLLSGTQWRPSDWPAELDRADRLDNVTGRPQMFALPLTGELRLR